MFGRVLKREITTKTFGLERIFGVHTQLLEKPSLSDRETRRTEQFRTIPIWNRTMFQNNLYSNSQQRICWVSISGAGDW